MNSKFILNVLRQRHKRDLFLSEVKNGPTLLSNTLLRMDAWTMKMSWKQDITGYEIKVDRSDFVGDQKWHMYLNYCNKFYWVCPTGLIKASEIDERCGLIYVNDDGSYRVVKRPLFRDVTLPPEIYRYILMWRVGSYEEPPKSRQELISEYVDDKLTSTELANRFKSKLLNEVRDLKNQIRAIDKKLYGWKDIIESHSAGEIKTLIESGGNNVDISALESARRLIDLQIRMANRS